MALREKMTQRVAQYLEPGEQVQQIFPAQSGMNPNWRFLSAWLVLFNKYWVVAATDRAVLVFAASRWRGGKPKALATRLARQTQIGPTSGALFSPIDVGGVKMYVHRRFYKDVQAADASAGGGWGAQPYPAT
jgi:hypothetical protein